MVTAECTASKKNKNEFYCKDDEKLGCEFINGVSYCCESFEQDSRLCDLGDKEKTDEDTSSVSRKPAIEKSTNDTEPITKHGKSSLTATTLTPNKSKVSVDDGDKKKKKNSNKESRTRRTTVSSSTCVDQGTECRFGLVN